MEKRLRLRTAVETAKCWRRFVAGLATDLGALRAEVRESWLRSKAAGVDPHSTRPKREALPQSAYKGADARLLAAGKPELVQLASALGNQPALAMLVNADSQVIALEVAGVERAGREVKTLLGVKLGEREAGTNCVGLALHLGSPVEVAWHENYAAWAHRWAGYAAPICELDGGAPAGALALVGCGGALAPHTRELARGAANAAARRLEMSGVRARLKVLDEFMRQQARFPERAILALSAEGRILGFSPAMGKLLGEKFAPQALGRRIGELEQLKLEGALEPVGENEPYEVSLQLHDKGAPERAITGMLFPLDGETGDKLRAGFLLVGPSGNAAASRPHGARSTFRANYGPADFVGESQAAKQTLKLVSKAAGYDWPVFMVGESGTGKELLAGAIHGLSPRASGPFVALDCSTIPPDLVASELFGYEEGTFTGGQRGGRSGKLELADGGTLFLDELADLPLNVQAGLLRFLEDRKVIPLGGRRVKTVDVRVVAAINTDPARAIAQGKLRFDLYYRLSVFKIVVPPLRDRREDIALLARHLLDREGFVDVVLADDALAALYQHPWPGNVRELRNVVLRAAASCSGRLITARDLMLEAGIDAGKALAPPARRSRGIDKEQLLQALEQCGWNKSHVAKLLSVHWTTVHRAMQRWGVTHPGGPEAEQAAKTEGERSEPKSTSVSGGFLFGAQGEAPHQRRSVEAKLRQKSAMSSHPRIGPLKWRR